MMDDSTNDRLAFKDKGKTFLKSLKRMYKKLRLSSISRRSFMGNYRKIICLLIYFLLISNAFSLELDLGTEKQRQSGKNLYLKYCAQCHGDKGDGKGIAAPFFKPAPRDFTRGVFKIRTTGNGELPTDEDLISIIENGMPYTGMPAFTHLSSNDLSNLVYFIKTFAGDFSDEDYIPTKIKFQSGPSFSEESAKKGRKVFIKKECDSCHGLYGRSDGKSAPTLEDKWKKHIRPADLTKRWTFRGGNTRKDIYRTFTTGMDGTPMPSFAESIKEEERWQLVDYVFSLANKSEPEYSTVLVANYTKNTLDISKGKSLFQKAQSSYFPIVGQVIAPGREFFPSANGVEVKAVYNKDEIALMLLWNDMTAEKEGTNSPILPVSKDEADSEGDSEKKYSDAVAVQLPVKLRKARKKPYFLSGDEKNPVDIWFMDMAKNKPEIFTGKGSDKIVSKELNLNAVKSFENGQWQVIFKTKRQLKNRLPIKEAVFIPIAFSIWDGFNNERGSKHGISSWYDLYLKPMQSKSILLPSIVYAMITLLFQLVIIAYIRKKEKVKNLA